MQPQFFDNSFFLLLLLLGAVLVPLQSLQDVRWRRWSGGLAWGLAGLGAAGLGAAWVAAHPIVLAWVAGARFQVALIGLFVGGVELIARYRDNPLRALWTWPAGLYILINIVAGLLALRALQVVRPSWLFEQTGARQLPFYLVLTGGFGAVALFRSSLFKVRTSDGELAVGPAVVLDTLLQASDRAVDRILASPRGTRVSAIMETVSFAKAKSALPSYCFAVMQNVSQQEQQAVASQIANLSAAEMTDRERSLNVGLVLLNVVGDSVLRSAVKDLGASIRADPPPPDLDIPGIADLMRHVDVVKAAELLPRLCFALGLDPSRELTPTERAKEWETFEAKIASLWTPVGTQPFEALRLGLVLTRLVGRATLEIAVRQLGREITQATSVPPGIDVQVLLAADLTRGVSFDKAALALPAYCFALAKAVPDDRKKALADGIKALREQAFSPHLKCLMMALLLVDAVGLAVLDIAIQQLGAEILA